MSNTIYVLPLLVKCSQGEDCAYVLTFQATGCPNKNPTQKQMAWWKKQSANKVFSDMLAYCERARDGKASSSQLQECCGEDNKCKPIFCYRQSTWVLTTGIIVFSSLSYILLQY